MKPTFLSVMSCIYFSVLLGWYFSSFIRIDYLLLFLYVALFLAVCITKKTALIISIMLSTIVAFIWMLLAHQLYHYNQEFLALQSIELFPFIAWSLALFIVYESFQYLSQLLFPDEKILKKAATFFLFYALQLIIFETIGYHWFNVHNLQTSQYPGLPLCNCMHAPPLMQLGYFLLGPVYYVLREYLKKRYQ